MALNEEEFYDAMEIAMDRNDEQETEKVGQLCVHSVSPSSAYSTTTAYCTVLFGLGTQRQNPLVQSVKL